MKKRIVVCDFLGRPLRDLVLSGRDVARGAKKVSRGQITKDWLPIPEAARLLRVTRRQVYDLIADKKLRAVPISWPGGYMIKWVTRASVERYSRQRYT